MFKASTCLLNNLQSKDNFFAASEDWLHDVLFKKPLYLVLHEIFATCRNLTMKKKLNSGYTLYYSNLKDRFHSCISSLNQGFNKNLRQQTSAICTSIKNEKMILRLFSRWMSCFDSLRSDVCVGRRSASMKWKECISSKKICLHWNVHRI